MIAEQDRAALAREVAVSIIHATGGNTKRSDEATNVILAAFNRLRAGPILDSDASRIAFELWHRHTWGPLQSLTRNGSGKHKNLQVRHEFQAWSAGAAYAAAREQRRAANDLRELVASLEETLAVAVRNETGEFADRAQSLLQKIRDAV